MSGAHSVLVDPVIQLYSGHMIPVLLWGYFSKASTMEFIPCQYVFIRSINCKYYVQSYENEFMGVCGRVCMCVDG